MTPTGLELTDTTVVVKKNGWTVFDLKRELSTMVNIPFKTMEIFYHASKNTYKQMGGIGEPLVSFSQKNHEQCIVFERSAHTVEATIATRSQPLEPATSLLDRIIPDKPQQTDDDKGWWECKSSGSEGTDHEGRYWVKDLSLIHISEPTRPY